MFDFLQSFGFSPIQWFLVIIAVASIGANKTGVDGLSIFAVPVLASLFGGIASTGVVLPFLIIADLFAVFTYRRAIRWTYLLRLLPWSLLGIGAALYVGKIVSDQDFKIIIAVIIMALLGLMIINAVRGKQIAPHRHWYVSAGTGILGGFSTMIGNAAGPVMAIYFISLRLTKNEYIATRAWFFWIINLIKVPLHLFIWHTITPRSIMFNLALAPAIAIGALSGIWIVRKIPEKPYKIFIITATFLSALLMLL